MRLIDADALREAIYEVCDTNATGLLGRYDTDDILDAAPTVSCGECANAKDGRRLWRKNTCQDCFCADHFERREP